MNSDKQSLGPLFIIIYWKKTKCELPEDWYLNHEKQQHMNGGNAALDDDVTTYIHDDGGE